MEGHSLAGAFFLFDVLHSHDSTLNRKTDAFQVVDQEEMVEALSERASKVHSGAIDPKEDNMLRITSDGRKLGLDQRLMNRAVKSTPA